MSYRRTEYSETMQIPQSSRGFFLRNRDSIKETHHVQLFFPRDQRFGDYQTMVIKGGPTSIAKARGLLNQILTEANQEFLDYRERQTRRKQWERKMGGQTAPSQSSPKQTKKNPVVKNQFALLNVDDGLSKKPAEKLTDEFPMLVRDDDELARKERHQDERRERKETDSVTKAPMSFAEAAAKPAVAEIPKEKPIPVPESTESKEPKKPMSWADMALEEDDEW